MLFVLSSSKILYCVLCPNESIASYPLAKGNQRDGNILVTWRIRCWTFYSHCIFYSLGKGNQRSLCCCVHDVSQLAVLLSSLSCRLL